MGIALLLGALREAEEGYLTDSCWDLLCSEEMELTGSSDLRVESLDW